MNRYFNDQAVRNVIARTAIAMLFGITMASAGGAGLAGSDVSFLIAAAEAGNAEIAASRISQTKRTSANVKAFAETMLSDHAKVADELKELASKKGVNVPDLPNAWQQAELSKLNALDDETFDVEYAQEIGVKAHMDAVALFATAGQNASDAEIRSFAAKTLLTLQHHLQMAQTLIAGTKK